MTGEDEDRARKRVRRIPNIFLPTRRPVRPQSRNERGSSGSQRAPAPRPASSMGHSSTSAAASSSLDPNRADRTATIPSRPKIRPPRPRPRSVAPPRPRSVAPPADGERRRDAAPASSSRRDKEREERRREAEREERRAAQAVELQQQNDQKTWADLEQLVSDMRLFGAYIASQAQLDDAERLGFPLPSPCEFDNRESPARFEQRASPEAMSYHTEPSSSASQPSRLRRQKGNDQMRHAGQDRPVVPSDGKPGAVSGKRARRQSTTDSGRSNNHREKRGRQNSNGDHAGAEPVRATNYASQTASSLARSRHQELASLLFPEDGPGDIQERPERTDRHPADRTRPPPPPPVAASTRDSRRRSSSSAAVERSRDRPLTSMGFTPINRPSSSLGRRSRDEEGGRSSSKARGKRKEARPADDEEEEEESPPSRSRPGRDRPASSLGLRQRGESRNRKDRSRGHGDDDVISQPLPLLVQQYDPNHTGPPIAYQPHTFRPLNAEVGRLFGERPAIKDYDLLGRLLLRQPRGGLHDHRKLATSLMEHVMYYALAPDKAKLFMNTTCQKLRLDDCALESHFKMEYIGNRRHVGIVSGKEDYFLKMEPGYSNGNNIDLAAYNLAATSKRAFSKWVDLNAGGTLNAENPKSWYNMFDIIAVEVYKIRWNEQLGRHEPPRNPNKKYKTEDVAAKLRRVYPWFNDWETEYDRLGTTKHQRKFTDRMVNGSLGKKIMSKVEPGKQVFVWERSNAPRGETELRISEMEFLLWHLDDSRMRIAERLDQTGGDRRFLNVIP